MNSSTFDSRVRRALQGEYQVEERLGQGGTATVYRARSEHTGRIVALKARRETAVEDESAPRFRREIEIHRSLDHPHIAAFIDSGRVSVGGAGAANKGAVRYLAMQHLDGGALSGRLQSRSPSVENACLLLQPVAAALHHVHEQGIVHRDVNPSNILLSEDGQAHLIDFSIALAPDHTPLGDGTLCTPAYMSPEQRGGEDPDSRSDIFSFGIVLYEALTGQKPFGTWMNREQEIAPPRELAPAVPAEVSDVVMRCLERDLDRRVQTARVLADALAPFTDGSTSTNANSTSQSSRSQSGTHAEATPDTNRSTARSRNVDPTTAIGFLESRPDFARSLISRWAEIPGRLIRAHPDFWDWDALSRNENLSWSASLLDEYARKWDWAALSANEAIPFDGDLIERHQRKWDWELLSVNQALPWSADLIRRFGDRWSWGVAREDAPHYGFEGALSMNHALPWSAELLGEFEHRWDWRILSGNPALPWSSDLLHQFRRRWTWGHQTWEEGKGKFDWGMRPKNGGVEYPTLSSNPGIPWSEELALDHSEILSWTELGVNPALPWSQSLIDRYHERWNWSALSANEGLPWSHELLDRYDEKWDWRSIACNEGLPWDDRLFDQAWKRAGSYGGIAGGGYRGVALGKNRAIPWDKQKSKQIAQRCWCERDVLGGMRSPILLPSSVHRQFLQRVNIKNGGDRMQHAGIVTPEALCWELNPALQWEEIIKNIDRPWRGWGPITANRGIPWSAALLSQFRDKFFPDHQSVLVENDQVWHRAFAPAVTEGVLRRLLREA